MMLRLSVFCLLLSSIILLAQADIREVEKLEPCGSCDVSKCPPTPQCSAGTVRDRCSCCAVCGLEESQLCNLETEWTALAKAAMQKPWHGRCGNHLECRIRTDVDVSTFGLESICFCQKPGLVCGSDGQTYSKCQLDAAVANSNDKLRQIGHGPCKTEPAILSISPSRAVAKNDKVTFLCEVQGYPMPAVSWYFRQSNTDQDYVKMPGNSDEISVSLRGGPQQTRITSHLQISAFDVQHEGQYRCMAENDLGMAVKNVSVVYSAPADSYEDGGWHNDEI